MKRLGSIHIFQKMKRTNYKSILVLLLLVWFTSCQDVKKPEMPNDLISQDKMVDILTDVYISNASRNVNHKLIKKRGLQLDSIIYNKYEVDSLQFVVSNAYYSSDLEIYEGLLTKVQGRLQTLQIEKDSIYKIVFKKDSIEKSKKKSPKKTELDKEKITSNTLINPVQSN